MKADATTLLGFFEETQNNQFLFLSIRGCIVGKRNNANNYGMIL